MNRRITPITQVQRRFINIFGGSSNASSNQNSAKRHFERRLIKYPAELLYEVVSDVNKYEEFVPWCRHSKVLPETKTNQSFSAELTVGFQYLTERYVSQVKYIPNQLVTAQSVQTNLFEYLKTEWKFQPANDKNHTWVTFEVDFKFKMSLYNELSDFFMKEVVAKMVKAFEQRCKQLDQQNRVQKT